MSNHPEEVEYFIRKYEAQIEPSRKRVAYKRPPYNYALAFDEPYTYSVDIEREPCVEITLPPERFRDLLDQQHTLTRLMEDSGRYGEMLAEMRAEERVRQDNPAVARAWRNYVTLLELARR